MATTTIEWTHRKNEDGTITKGKTWNPVTGCTKVSQGCKNCYAERIYERFNGHGSFKNVTCHQDRLTHPMKWKKPSTIFVNSMSDLFHEDVPFIFIDAVFSVMSDVDHHIYQVLTKRPQRMLEFFKWKSDEFGVPWQPKPNVWLGVSVESDKNKNRIDDLRKIPATVRFLSIEPLLDDVGQLDLSGIHWVIVGGESGPGARPMNPQWAQSVRDQCASAGVPFFFKQWGAWSPYGDRVGKKKAGRILDGNTHDQFPGVSIPKKLGI